MSYPHVLTLLSSCRTLYDLPPEQHLFCDLVDDISSEKDVHDDKVVVPTPDELVTRRDLVFDCMQIYAYDGDDSRPHQERLRKTVDGQLGKCDVCIGAYYRTKRHAMERLIE